MMLAISFVLLQIRLTRSTTRRILPNGEVELGDVPSPVEFSGGAVTQFFISTRFSDEALKWRPHRRRQLRNSSSPTLTKTRDLGSRTASVLLDPVRDQIEDLGRKLHLGAWLSRLRWLCAH